MNRSLISISILLVMIAWEYLLPKRKLVSSRKYRWGTNLSLALFNVGILKLTGLDIAYASTQWTLKNSYGILNVF